MCLKNSTKTSTIPACGRILLVLNKDKSMSKSDCLFLFIFILNKTFLRYSQILRKNNVNNCFVATTRS